MHREAEKQLQSAFRMSDSGEVTLESTPSVGKDAREKVGAGGPSGAPGAGNEGKPPAHLVMFLWLVRCYLRMDQPLNAIQVSEKGLERFPANSQLLKTIARIYEVRILSFSSTLLPHGLIPSIFRLRESYSYLSRDKMEHSYGTTYGTLPRL